MFSDQISTLPLSLLKMLLTEASSFLNLAFISLIRSSAGLNPRSRSPRFEPCLPHPNWGKSNLYLGGGAGVVKALKGSNVKVRASLKICSPDFSCFSFVIHVNLLHP